MKIAILTTRYPRPDSPYRRMFIHTRASFYKKKGLKVDILTPSFGENSYYFEDIHIIEKPAFKLARLLENYDLFHIHLLHFYPLPYLSATPIYKKLIQLNKPIIFYFHGAEIEKFKFQKPIIDHRLKDLIQLIYHDSIYLKKLGFFLKNFFNSPKNLFIFPSRWLLKVGELSLNLPFPPKKTLILPNPINTKLFNFKDLYPQKYKLLCLRPLMKLYRLLTVIQTMLYLPPCYTLDIFGQGPLEEKIKKMIQDFRLEGRVKLEKKFFLPSEMPPIFENYGFIFTLSYTDTQGVTRCEAMSKGLITINSDVAAVPEFIRDLKNGILIEDHHPRKIAQKIELVANSPNLYRNIAHNARNSVEPMDIEKIGKMEIKLMEKLWKK